MYQAHRRTLRIRPETEEGVFVKKLATSVILRAVQDLLSSNDRQADGAGSSVGQCHRNGFSGRMCLHPSRHGAAWRT
jgi:hypothetical protein